MRRSTTILCAGLIAVSMLPISSHAQPIDITGDWQCEYSVKSTDQAPRTTAAWFQVSFRSDAKFAGGGKTIAGGSALSMQLNGKYSVAGDGLLKMTGVSEIARQRVPFRFVSNVLNESVMERRAKEGSIAYHTQCTREPS